MPTETDEDVLVVPVATSVRTDIFYSMEVERQLVLHPDQADRIARDFARTVAPVTFRSDASLSDMLNHRVYRDYGIGSIPLDVARNLLQRASNNRATLEYDASTVRVSLVPVSKLDQKAWDRYNDPYRMMYVSVDAVGGVELDLERFKRMTDAYSYYTRNARMGLLREIVGMKKEIKDTPMKPIRFGTGDFNAFFHSFHESLVITPDPLRDIAILPHGTLSSRLWGIEIEAVDIAGIETPEGWALHGDGSLSPELRREMDGHVEGCATFLPPVCGHDPDVDGCTNDCDCGFETSNGEYTTTGEWNSPVLRSVHSRGLQHLMTELEGRQWNHSAGIHVHVEASDLTPTQVAHATLLYNVFEPLFEEEYNREDRGFCKQMSSGAVLRRAKDYKAHEKQYGRKSSRTVDGGDRYVSVNTVSLADHGTIEFRAMGPTYDYEHLVRWATFVREIVNMGKAGVPQKAWGRVRTFRDLVLLMSKYGKETPTPEWAKDQAEKDLITALGKESRRRPNKVRRDDGVVTVFEDYAATKAFTTSSPSRRL